MPHIIVEYSANLDAHIDIARVVRQTHAAAVASGVFEVAAVRTRAERRETYEIADGDPANAFVHVTARIGPGRSSDARRRLGQILIDAVTGALGVVADGPLALSVEVQELDDTATFRRNNLHARFGTKRTEPVS